MIRSMPSTEEYRKNFTRIFEEPLFYTTQEGGPWLMWKARRGEEHVHSKKWADGTEWDEVNGVRR